jgi:hypothetical protein
MRKKQGLSFYILTEEIVKRRLSPHSISLTCSKCGKEIKIGQEIVRKRRKLYHLSCWNSMWLDIPDNLSTEEQFYVEQGFYPTTITTFSTIPVDTSHRGAAATIDHST